MYRRTKDDLMSFGRTKVDPINFGRTKVDPLEVGELLSILHCIDHAIIWVYEGAYLR